jgi:hypothetical protein
MKLFEIEVKLRNIQKSTQFNYLWARPSRFLSISDNAHSTRDSVDPYLITA